MTDFKRKEGQMFKPRNRVLASVGAGLLALGLAGSSGAAVVNAGFETGDLAGWTSGRNDNNPSNLAGAVDASYMAPLRGNYSALLIAPSIDDCFPGIPPYEILCHLRPLPFAQPLAGPALAHAFPDTLIPLRAPGFGIVDVRSLQYIGQDIQLDAGTGISLDWRWLSNEGVGPDYLFSGSAGDQGFAFMTNGVDFVGLNAQCPDGAFGPIDFVNTGFRYGCDMLGVALRAPSSGVWTLYIGVANGMDNLTSSGLMVDDVQVVRIPVPGSASLAGLALAVLAAVHRKRTRGLRAPA